jgi:DNA-binding GntR family transcriptional regulator
MTVADVFDHRLVAIASRYHATSRADAGGADALSDMVVVPTLREAIVDNVLAPGSRLREVQLAAQLGVSRTPLREAFAQLEREGLVTVLPRAGVFVREVTLRDVDEIYRVRAALEGMAVELAARNLTPLGRARLDAAVDAMREQVEANDPAAYTRELDAFYATVMDLADNTVLHRTHDGLLGPVRRLRRIAMSRQGRMSASYRQTVRIKDAINRGDLACVALMHEQLAKACEAAKDALRASGG